MVAHTLLLARKMLLPLGAAFLGAWAFVPPEVGIADRACHVFEGQAEGNDPTAQMSFYLCRAGDRVEGHQSWRGQSGHSASLIEGRVDADGHIHLWGAEPLLDEPNPGWTFCYDDTYDLVWDADEGALVGRFASAACEDRGEIVLARGAERWDVASVGCH